MRQLLSFAFGLLLLLLLLKLFPSLVLLTDQSLELTGQLPGKIQGLEDFLVLGNGQLLVLIELLATLAVGSVTVKLGLGWNYLCLLFIRKN